MSQKHISLIATEHNVSVSGVAAVVALLDEGATVPFISRYRKEQTGSLDEVAVAYIKDRIAKLRDLDKRREAILKSIDEQGKLTDELKKKIEAALTMTELEDIYLPYKPKRKTRGSMAKEKGLEPLAKVIFDQGLGDPVELALQYVDEEKEVKDAEEALQGARDIIAEWVSEDAEVRAGLRKLFLDKAVIKSTVMKGKEQEGQKYKDYFEWEEPLKKCPSHRLLAMRRGEKEMILSLDIFPDENDANFLLEKKIITGQNANVEQVKIALKDAYKRLLKPSMETETRVSSKKTADDEAIQVFSENLRQLLLSPALGQKNVLALDPGFRTGCKVVCLDKQGKLLEFEAIFPHEPQRRTAEAAATIKHMVEKHQIEAIAIGNGTASRESESFIRSIGLPSHIIVAMVSESGASIYSASEVAREEFPDQDLTVRGAVSIGRRMMDPLAELVKIDAKSIGVGQYQHDVDQNSLKHSLDEVVERCVNGVGVELNTASKQLLTYVSGLGPQLAENIVKYRNENGPFKNRAAVKKVPRMGDKAFEQAAGFLRIRESDNVLDASAVHPERYATVEKMAADLNSTVAELVKDSVVRAKIDPKKYVTDEVGLPTLKDIMDELAKPGRDPREQYEVFSFQEGVNAISDLREGMKLPGIVTNITKFGAFVDVGVHQDGLVHVSQLSDSFVSDPAAVVKLQQQVQVTVTEINVPQKRISLSMKSDPFGKPKKKFERKQEAKQEAQGDLQSKLAMLKGKFNS
ncbi:RNA-binding transcriptional accessory protein [Reichenbachiella carrageenanivorans]|uniref:RNA-binding transcriptional accessory protein n=1 Tax=Reichenbachiella carrageenanivorans TaxID=2979869 RepID=A0ABY6CXT7_9BACT|nr:Tex family protein [Reichenbachiella carrageenanivorans]UXX77613.1 RNA-binding transcriptional accessory protein [Reichenbachiella carrageenanivorans]